MTDDYLEVCLRLVTIIYYPEYASLADSIQCKSSEQNTTKYIQLYYAIGVHSGMQGTKTYIVYIKYNQYINELEYV